MTNVIFPEGDESIKVKYKDNEDGSYTPYVEAEVIVSGELSTDALTDAELRASAVTISGFVTEQAVLVVADADITQLITITSSGTPVQGPNVTNPGGWLLIGDTNNTKPTYYMFHGQTVALKGYPLPAGGPPSFVPVSNLNVLDFGAEVNGEKVHATKL